MSIFSVTAEPVLAANGISLFWTIGTPISDDKSHGFEMSALIFGLHSCSQQVIFGGHMCAMFK